MPYTPPKTLDLNTTVLVLALFEGFETNPNHKVEQSCRTIVGILRGLREELLRQQVVSAKG